MPTDLILPIEPGTPVIYVDGDKVTDSGTVHLVTGDGLVVEWTNEPELRQHNYDVTDNHVFVSIGAPA